MFQKKIIRFLLLIIVCFSFVQISFAQQVTVINQKGTKIDVINNTVTTGAEPTSPLIADIWFDTITNISKIYDGIQWIELDVDTVTTASIAPAIPVVGDIWFDNTDVNSVITKIWDGTSWLTIKAKVVSTDTNNDITLGTDGGAYFQSPIKAFAKVEITYDGSDNYTGHSIAKELNVNTITRVSEGVYDVIFDTALSDLLDDNYIIQLTVKDCEGNCPGTTSQNYDDIGITYSSQSNTGFRILIGDSDNGSNRKDPVDIEFMLTVISLF
ncbi:hypothetical protein [Lutibacter sp. B1]|uniref:hypothetical protein n=1 Tax=Lutibacter sp. B1 TaxID=2725996 RepID=UPI001456F6C7|nr:hypothetical protein [Lutibacter sp. B1]NLP56680.1 hypothetical protein [Lutibacter sp. B1]